MKIYIYTAMSLYYARMCKFGLVIIPFENSFNLCLVRLLAISGRSQVIIRHCMKCPESFTVPFYV